jgi:hypothetical protein
MKKLYILLVKKEGTVPSKYFYLTKQRADTATKKFQKDGYTVTPIVAEL